MTLAPGRVGPVTPSLIRGPDAAPSTGDLLHAGRRRRPRRGRAPLVVALVAVAVITVIRVVIHARWGSVTGLDTGNWFTFGNAWIGDPLSDGAASTYPPVIPVAVALLGRVLDPLVVMLIVGAVAALVHGGAAAVVLWRWRCGWWTVPLATTLTAGSAVGEAIAWGGTPQLLGLGLALLVLSLTAEMLTTPTLRVAAALGVSGLLLGATSHLVLAETALAAAVMLTLRFLSPIPAPTRAGLRRLAGLWSVAAAPCLVLLPLYVNLAGTVGGSFAARRGTQPHIEFLGAVEAVSRELPDVWKPAIVFSLLLPAVLWRERHRPLWLVTAAISTVLAVVGIASPEPRFAYLVPLLLLCACGLLASTVTLTGVHWVIRLAIGVAAFAGCMASAHGGLAAFPHQVSYYGAVVPAGTTEALEELRTDTDPDDVVAVPPVRGLPFGWWVEGYGRRAAYVGSSTKWLNFPRERERAQISVRLFSAGDVFSDRWFASARSAGVDVVYVPSAYDGITTDAVDSLRKSHPDLILLSDSAATIVEVPQ